MLGEEPVLEDVRANCFGFESGGLMQVRGNGCLVLGAEELVFVRWLPRRTWRIALGDVLVVDAARSHLGKTVGRELLRVRFATERGDADAVAWRVRDLAAWLRALGAC